MTDKSNSKERTHGSKDVKLPDITKLTRHNYKTWAFDIRLELEELELWNITSDDDAVFETLSTENKRKAFRLMARSISDDIKNDILDITCPRELWRKLSSRFQPKTRLRRLQASKSLYSAKMNVVEDMETYINRVFGYASEVVKAGSEKICDEQVCNVLVNGLPEDYETLVSMICTFKDDEYTPEKLETLLLGEYKRKQGKKEEQLTDQNSSVLLASRETRGKFKCHYCKEEGHIIKFCPVLLAKRKSDWKKKEEGVQGQTSMLCFSAAWDMVTNNAWLIDSGASSHFTPNRKDFSVYEELKTPQMVKLASNLSCEIVGIGTVNIVSRMRNGEFPISFKQVYHVPDFHCRLLSIARIEMAGFKVVIQGGACRVFRGNDILIEARRNNGNMYVFQNFEFVQSALLSSVEVEVNWHKRLGHINNDLISRMCKRGSVRGLDEIPSDCKVVNCEPCLKGKNARQPFPKVSHFKTYDVLELIHSDVCSLPVESNSKFKYFVSFIDDFSKRAMVYFMRQKSEVLSCFRKFKMLCENQTGKTIKCLRSDNGGEYINKKFEFELDKYGIVRQLSCPYSPQQNGVAERFNRTILDLTRAMLIDANTPKSFWAEAVNTACYIRNRCPLDDGRTPEEIWTGRKPSVKHLRPFGCKAFAHIPKESRKKLDARATECIMLGYGGVSKGYRLWDLEKRSLIVSRDVVFVENEFPLKERATIETIDYSDLSSESFAIEVQQDQSSDIQQPVEQQVQENERDMEIQQLANEDEMQEANESDEDGQPEEENEGRQTSENHENQIKLRDRSKLKKPDYYCCTTAQTVEPKTYKQAMSGSDRDLWAAAIEEELNSLNVMGVWELSDLPPGKSAIGCKWVFKIKTLADGSIERYKARLVAQGFTQKEGVDYDETYSPVISLPAVRLILKLAVKNNWLVHQMDVKTAYLNGELKEEIYMKQPEGATVPGNENKVCRLLKSLYGLRQSGRSWYETLDKRLRESGMKKCLSEQCIYFQKVGSKMVIILVYVDDLIIVTSDQESMEMAKKMLRKHFEMKDMGELHYILGIEVTRRSDGSLDMSQKKYIKEILEEFGMIDCRPVATPIDIYVPLTKAFCPATSEEKKDMEGVPYRRLVGKLMYLAQATRPDLSFVVSRLGQFASNPGRPHWVAAKRVLRYLKGTMDYEFLIDRQGEDIVAYSDSDYAGCKDDRKSTTGYVIQFGSTPVIWKSNKQTSVALSTMQAEFVALASSATDIVWLRYILEQINWELPSVPCVKCDNQAAMNFAKGNNVGSHSRHIDTKYFYIRDMVNAGALKIDYISTVDNNADIFTKPLPKRRNEEILRRMNIKIKEKN